MIKYFGLTLDRRQNLSKTRKPITILLLFRLDYSIVKFVQSSFTHVRISITSRFINLLRSTETAVASLCSQPGSRLVVNEAWANPNLQTQMESWKLLAGSRLAIKIDNPWGLWREVKWRRSKISRSRKRNFLLPECCARNKKMWKRNETK